MIPIERLEPLFASVPFVGRQDVESDLHATETHVRGGEDNDGREATRSWFTTAARRRLTQQGQVQCSPFSADIAWKTAVWEIHFNTVSFENG